MTAATLGQRLKEARYRADLSQSQVARAIGVTDQTPRRWEKDKNRPHPRQIRALADLFGVDEDHFTQSEEPAPAPESAATQEFARALEQFIQDALRGAKREHDDRWNGIERRERTHA